MTEAGVMLLDLPTSTSTDSYVEHLYGVFGNLLEHTDILVLRLPTTESTTFKTAMSCSAASIFQKRVPRASIHVLYSDGYQHHLTTNRNTEFELPEPINNVSLIRELKQIELETIAFRSGAVFTSRHNYLFKSPSGSYCSKFIRVGNVQTSRSVLNTFFFWMLPFLKDSEAILTETWSISSIALNASLNVRNYDPLRISPQIEMLSSYHDRSAEFIENVNAIVERLQDQHKPILFIISAVATGTSLERLKKTLDRFESSKITYLALYKLCSGVDVSALCDLTSAFENGTPISAERTPRNPPHTSVVIDINKHTYFPLQIYDSTVALRKKHAALGRSFLERYQGKGVFRTHYEVRDKFGSSLRHHAIDINVEAMLDTLTFKRRLNATLKQLIKDPNTSTPQYLIVPPHVAGEKLATYVQAFVQKTVNAKPSIITHHDLDVPLGDPIHTALSSLGVDTSILIVDDVSITGTRLSRYQRNLRALGYRGIIVYLVGVVRAASKVEWEDRSKHLRYRDDERHNPVHAVEEITLPNWDHTKCPWCSELEMLRTLNSLTTSSQVSDLLSNRVAELARAPYENGMVKNAFWTIGPSLALTPNSIFYKEADSSHSDVFAAAASTLQNLRMADPLSEGEILGGYYPHISVISEKDYLGTKFNDHILRVAIMRASMPQELERSSDKMEENRKMLFQKLIMDEKDLPILEYIVAMLARKIPFPRDIVDDLPSIYQDPINELLQLAMSEH